jgi:hypothetical protein
LAAPELTAQADAATHAPRTEVEMLRQRQMMLATHFPQALREADERAFEKLGVTEDKRAAIRLLNERVTRVLENDLARRRDPSLPKQPPGAAATTGDVPDRRDALEGILGLADARAFRSFETAEIRRIQVRFIRPFDADMDKAMLAAPGPPPAR